MIKSIITIVAALVLLTSSAFAQIDSVHFGGYVMTQAPHDSVKSFTNRWAVTKLTLYSDGVRGEFQYDLASNCMVAAQGCIPKSLFGGEATLYVGATFTAAGQITPAPNQLNGKLWFPVYNSYTFIGNGIGVGFNRGPLSMYVVRTNEFSAAVTFHGIEMLWQEDFAKTIAVNSSKLNVLGVDVSYFAGYTWYNGDREDQITACYNFDYKAMRLYFGANGGDIHNYVSGARYDFNSHIRVKYQYNFTSEEHFMEAVFSF
jgi:hypothetical protein